jgi:hypothetical protein
MTIKARFANRLKNLLKLIPVKAIHDLWGASTQDQKINGSCQTNFG